MTKTEKQASAFGLLLLLLLWLLLRKRRPREVVTSKIYGTSNSPLLDSGNPLWQLGGYGLPGWKGLTR